MHINTHTFVCVFVYLITSFTPGCYSQKDIALPFKVTYESLREFLNTTNMGSTKSITFKKKLTNILN